MCTRACSNSNCTFMLLDWHHPLVAIPIPAPSTAPIHTPERPCDFSRVDLVVASDVAYDPQLTQAFFVCLRLLLLAAPPHAIALVTLERRVNFSASMCDVVALDADVFADVSSLLLPPPLTRHPPPLTR